MASLTEAAVITRKAIRYTIYTIIFLIIARIVFSIGKNLYARLFPEPPPPPTLGYGKLPHLPFPDSLPTKELTYTLETPEGGLPALPDQVDVYFMIKPTQTQLNLPSATTKARSLGFDSEPQSLSQTIYRFKNSDGPATLEMNIVTNAFSVSYDFTNDPSLFNQVPPTPDVGIEMVRNYLDRAKLLPDDLSGAVKHEFLQIEEQRLIPAPSLSEANFIKINLYRKNYPAREKLELPAVTPDPDESNIWFIVSGARDQEKQVIAAQYHYFPIDEEEHETYPVKTAQTAFEELKAGNAYFANIEDVTGSVVIRRVYLAYYDAGQETEFYQPVVVFEGDNNFVAYVPAITADYYGE